MQAPCQISTSGTTVVLTNELVVGALGLLHVELLACHDRGLPAILDGSAVTRIDAAGAQLLTAFCRDGRQAGRVVRWSAVSPCIRAIAQMLGLESELFAREAPP